MNVAELVAKLQEISPRGTMQVKISTHLLDENGADISPDLLVQEYDDGYISNEIVLFPMWSDY